MWKFLFTKQAIYITYFMRYIQVMFFTFEFITILNGGLLFNKSLFPMSSYKIIICYSFFKSLATKFLNEPEIL